jgi:hypothetical protein
VNRFQIPDVIVQIPKPSKASTKAIMMKIITATMLIANALSQPQSKKCFIKASQMMS